MGILGSIAAAHLRTWWAGHRMELFGPSSKLLSDNVRQYPDAAVEGIRRLLRLKPSEKISPEQVRCVKMGTTVATNALLERKGERTLLVTTVGFRDGLRIAYQNRPKLFERHIVLPELLYERVIEANESRAGGLAKLICFTSRKCVNLPPGSLTSILTG